jgi:outer membrane protein FlgP
MKKFIALLLIFLAAGLVFSGCSASTSGKAKITASAPGKVLGPADGNTNRSRAVTFFVIGKGLEPEDALTKGEAVLMAERAAVADGYRQLAEKLRGVYIDAYMRAGRGTVDYDLIRTQTQSWLRGTEIVEFSDGRYGITQVRMRLRINFSKKGMIWWPAGIGDDVEPVLAPS